MTLFKSHTYLLLTGLISLPSSAHSIYFSTSKTEQEIQFKEHTVNFNPQGLSAALTFDLSEQLFWSFDYASWQQDKVVTRRLDADLAIDSYGTGVNYLIDDHWSISSYFTLWQDNVTVYDANGQFKPLVEETDSKSYAVNLNWGQEYDLWYFNTALAWQMNQWQQVQLTSLRDKPGLRAEQDLDTQFLTVSVDASYFFDMSEHYALVLGSELGWHQLLTEKQITRLKNQKRPNSQRAPNNTHRNARNLAQNLSGHFANESYAHIDLYSTLLLGERWSVSASYSHDFATELTGHSFALGLGYSF